jgi:hypothetical protein
MSRWANPRGGLASRRPTPDPRQLRQAWIEALALAEALGVRAQETAEQVRAGEFGLSCTRFTVLMRDLKAEAFPVQGDTVRTMASCFLALASKFAHPQCNPEARTACAPFLAAGAKALAALIEGVRLEEARGGRRVLGERDED